MNYQQNQVNVGMFMLFQDANLNKKKTKMKISELIKSLEKSPKDLKVLIASDDERNSFRPILNGWISVEKFSNMDLIAEEDYHEYDDLMDYILIG